ncbi:hypothetical protein [Acinetobacter sp. YH01020]|uniref:hypothetical protein n=1 Tax=Acinetobacter sp. YH01020 TaxID=2601034 RepID=UPI0015D2EAD7|nr:hypothetical protein [Acinetobacter sp. YH01020]
MKTIVTYVDNTEDLNCEILTKEYEGFKNAYLPNIGDVIVVYSEHEHDQIEFKVIELRVLVNRDYDQFHLILERTN